MFPLKRFFSASASLLAVVLLVTACNPDGGNEPPQRYGPKIAGQSLIGPNLNPAENYRWDSGYGDSFKITEASGVLKFSYAYDDDDNDAYDNGFNGTIVGDVADDISLLRCKWGYITIHIDSVSGSSTLTMGSYNVIHWKDLGSGLVNEAGPYRTGSPYNNGMSTQAAAEAEYTVENGYFGFYGLYNITQ